MADFLADTQVEPVPGSPGRYRAALSPEWAVWGPNGGYLAAIALRAVLAESRLPRPASFTCAFLAVGEFAPVDISVSRLGGGKRAESLRAELRQGDRRLLSATAWVVDDGLEGYAHDVGVRPGVPEPEALRGFQDLAGDEYAQWYPIWRSIEGRPVRWREGPGEPVWHTWMRLTHTEVGDREGDAVRQLLWLDFPGWNATISAYTWPFTYLMPNLDLTVHFQRFAPEVEWILCDGSVPMAGDGVASCVGRLWTPDGRLLATGISSHVCRPNPRYEEELARARELGLLPETQP